MGSQYSLSVKGGSTVGAITQGENANVTATVNYSGSTLSQEQHRTAVQEAQAALVHDQDSRPGTAVPRSGMTASYDAMCKLLPAQFDSLVKKLAVPEQYLSERQAAIALRAGEVIRWVEQDQSLRAADLQRVLTEVMDERGGGEA